MTTRHRRIQRAALLAGAALLGAHFSIAAFSQAPLSPAKIRLHAVITGYLEPYLRRTGVSSPRSRLKTTRG